ncbi:hypothetical protein KQX54_003774 [Cotesia glomerata]|uniref:Uncharacterized protein n=1 Tax=Cotesia glomerata TaxID=32391 RepID=A0AAV7IAU9_COTGL|nr:hypothetical protein KQX54_003774 [Cotesia glomerata]
MLVLSFMFRNAGEEGEPLSALEGEFWGCFRGLDDPVFGCLPYVRMLRLAGYPWETDFFLRVKGNGGLLGMGTFITGDHWRYPDT